MTAYYNEFDPLAAAWLQELMRRGLIADGWVDTRSILDVDARDLEGFTQCHFFAGIGGWSYALRLAGWPDERPVWTGSPPCQPFSAAGKGLGQDDERHLGPHFLRLIADGQPDRVFGEQVASAAVFGPSSSSAKRKASGPGGWCWLDDISDRFEAAHYAFGALDIPGALIGAPHIRQRTFFGAARLADANECGQSGPRKMGRPSDPAAQEDRKIYRVVDDGRVRGLADTELQQRQGCAPSSNEARGRHKEPAEASGLCGHIRLADTESSGRGEERANCGGELIGNSTQGQSARFSDGSSDHPTNTPHQPWRDADWLGCRDGKWRPVESGTFPLVDGVPARVGRLRGYGNAIVPQAAAKFIEIFEESLL